MADHQLAVHPNRNVAVLRVDHAHVDPGYRTSEGARADLPWRLIVEEDAHHFGHAPDFDQRKTEALLEDAMKLRLRSGADAKAHGMPALLFAGRPAEQQRHYDAEIVHHGRTGLSDLGPPAVRMKPIRLDLAASIQQCTIERYHRRIAVIDRQRIVDALAL